MDDSLGKKDDELVKSVKNTTAPRAILPKPSILVNPENQMDPPPAIPAILPPPAIQSAQIETPQPENLIVPCEANLQQDDDIPSFDLLDLMSDLNDDEVI